LILRPWLQISAMRHTKIDANGTVVNFVGHVE
jgi:hypothetical protein